METIFDHNITDQERKYVVPTRSGQSKEYYLAAISQRQAYDHIAALYYHRGDNRKGDRYAEKRDGEIRFVDFCE